MKNKEWKYTVNNPIEKGTYEIKAENKKEAIEKAKKEHKLGGVNTSSFKIKK